MKQLSIIILAVIAFSTNCMAQDRNNAAPAQLATKSKEIKSALYWQQDRKTGKWESRKNTTLVYLGEGVAVDNFNSLFIGEYAGRRYLFCDFKEYSWRYPVLQTEWIVSRLTSYTEGQTSPCMTARKNRATVRQFMMQSNDSPAY